MISCSVIIPTFNRLEDLQTCLPTLRAQDIQGVDWEVLIVDNGSTDGTAEWSKGQVGGFSPRVRYHWEPMPGLLSGRQRGAAEAKGNLLTFIDDDIQAFPGWLRAIHSSFEDTQVNLVGGPSLPNYDVEPPQWLDEFWETTPYGRACAYLSLLDFGNARIEISPHYVWGLNFSIRSRALRDLGGFHPDTVPSALQQFQGDGETGVSLKALMRGYKSVYEPAARVLHRVPASRMTIEYFEKRAYFQGVADSYSQTRQQHNLYSRPKRSVIKGLKRRLDSAGRVLATSALGKPTVAHVLSGARSKVQAAYERGFAFHQEAMQSDPAVREWVLRPDYWDYGLPGA